MKILLAISASIILGAISNNKLSAQLPTVNDLILNVSNLSEQQKRNDALIFAAYGQKPYIPNKVDPTLNFGLAKEKLHKLIRLFLLKRGNQPAYYNTNTKVSLNRVSNVVVTDEYLQFTKPHPELAIDTVTVRVNAFKFSIF